MKYFKLFENFIQDLESPVNESNKWTKQELEALNKFASKLSKVDPKGFDPTTYNGVHSAVMNLYAITSDIAMMGDNVWALKNKDKCRSIRWDEYKWVDATPEDADKGAAMTEEYVKACEAVFQEGLKAIQLVEKGEGEKLEQMLAKLESDTDKLFKMNRKWQKSRSIGTWTAKKENNDEEEKSKWEFHNKIIESYMKSTSNKDAIEELQKKLKK